MKLQIPNATDIGNEIAAGLDIDIEQLEIGGITFHIPKTKDGQYVLFECIPDCGKCCRDPRWLSLTLPDITRLSNHFKMKPEEFLEKKAYWVNGSRGIPIPYLKRQRNDTEKTHGLPMTCRFLKDQKEDHADCDIYEARPLPCRMYPFDVGNKQYPVRHLGYGEGALKQCPGFYLSKTIEPIIPFLEQEAKALKQAKLTAVP